MAQRKYIKNIQTEIVSIGFPMAVLESIIAQHGLETTTRLEKQIVLRAPSDVSLEQFDSWKASIEKKGPRKLKKIENENRDTTQSSTDIVMMIGNFPLDSKTPMECMLFVSELKKYLTHTDAL